MASSVKMTITGIKEVSNYLNKKKKNVVKQEQIGLTNAAIFMQGEVKQSIAGRRNEHVSVDTGRFLNSVDINIGKKDAVIFSDVEYGQFLEYGTSRFTGRRHFNNSKDRNKAKLGEIMQKAIKNI